MDRNQRKALIGGILKGIPYLERFDLLSLTPDQELSTLHHAVERAVDAIVNQANELHRAEE